MPWSRRSLGVAPLALLQSRLNSRRILSDINTSSASRSRGRDAPSAREIAPHDQKRWCPALRTQPAARQNSPITYLVQSGEPSRALRDTAFDEASSRERNCS